MTANITALRASPIFVTIVSPHFGHSLEFLSQTGCEVSGTFSSFDELEFLFDLEFLRFEFL